MKRTSVNGWRDVSNISGRIDDSVRAVARFEPAVRTAHTYEHTRTLDIRVEEVKSKQRSHYRVLYMLRMTISGFQIFEDEMRNASIPP